MKCMLMTISLTALALHNPREANELCVSSPLVVIARFEQSQIETDA